MSHGNAVTVTGQNHNLAVEFLFLGDLWGPPLDIIKKRHNLIILCFGQTIPLILH